MAAAAARKLAKEIDVTLKKVEDGMEEFDRYMEEAESATCGKEKDKLGEELKKCINRQQRLRGQIREWLSSIGDTKERPRLEASRKRIEDDMQRFKEFERELKTKAFSTFALKNGPDMGMEDEEKSRSMQWLNDTLQTLQSQLDDFDVDLETCSNDDRDNLLEHQRNHRWHIGKLEQLLRGVTNDDITPVDLAFCTESVDYYVESHREDDFMFDDSVYESFDLAEVDIAEESKSPSLRPAEVPDDVGSAKKKGKDRNSKKSKKEETRAKAEVKSPMAKAAASPKMGPGAKPPVVRVTGGEIVPIDAEKPEASGKKDPGHNLDQYIDPDEVKVQEDQLLCEADEFVCKICYVHVVGAGPVLTSCSHLFCGDCFCSWLAQHPESQSWAQRAKQGPERTVPCPVCKQVLQAKSDLHPVSGATSRSENLLLWRMLSSLKITCSNAPKVRTDGRCNWVGEYGNFQKHIKSCKNEVLEECKDKDTSDKVTTVAQEVQGSLQTTAMPTPETSPQMQAASWQGEDADSIQTTPDSGSPSQSPERKVSRGEARTEASTGATVSQEPASNGLEKVPSPQTGTPVRTPTPHVPPPREAPKSPAAKPAAPTAPPAGAKKVTHVPAPREAPKSPVAKADAPPGGYPKVSAPKSPAVNPKSPTVTPKPAPTEAPKPKVVAPKVIPAPKAEPVAAAPKVAPTPPEELVVAINNFEPSGSDSATLIRVSAGDCLSVCKRHESGWSFCKNLNSQQPVYGWVPNWALPSEETPKAEVKAEAKAEVKAEVKEEVTVPTPTTANLAKVLVAFTAQENSQLTLRMGDEVDIIERHTSGWTFGRINGSEGWFPNWACSGQ
eukprot:gnl/MRDRNA2_/MRDRNA2_101083_c0_seq1.p1 gnl/MRDRNA2_/MRDRNA2_101083_c0~~gnl/MRDRNA2_/MRDRNA2_101083_c0_seq1.p1  ORF type:complete len:838 (+),score=204.78 gnl/MRDRNA2_/MRDRNA2_101083_c0_seq1:103-2616(+)